MRSYIVGLTQRLFTNDTANWLIRSSLVKNVSGSFALQIFALTMRFLTSILLARLLTTVDYGTFTYVISWMLTLAVPAALGFDMLLVREVAAYRAQELWSPMRGLVRVAMITGIGLSMAIVLVLFVYSNSQTHVTANLFLLPLPSLDPMVYQTGLQTFWIGLLLLPSLVILNLQARTMRGFRAIIPAQLPRMVFAPVAFLLLSGIASIIGSSHLTSQQVMVLRVVAFSGAVFYSVYLLRKTLPDSFITVTADYTGIKSWFVRSFPMLGNTFLGSLYARVDVLMLGMLHGYEEVAHYNVVLVISSLVAMVLSSASVSLGPLFSEYYAAGQMDKLQRLAIKSARGILAASLPIVVILIAGGDFMLSLYGPAYRASFPALAILLLGQFINMVTGSVGLILTMTGYERYSLASRIIGLIAYIGLNALLIPVWGGIGAAVATSVSMTVLNILLVWFVWRKLGISVTAFTSMKV